eukprot:Skav204637  [mRNA]  locus=scaffold1712:394783:397559:- [translate_table: standard]
MEPPQKKLCTSLRGTSTGAVHGDTLAVEEGDVPPWVFSLAQAGCQGLLVFCSQTVQIGAELRAGDLIWLETPLNPTCEVADIQAYVAAAKAAKADVRVVVDGTFAPPPLQRPLLLGVDAVMHATTKSLAGHSDASGGAVCVATAEEAQQLRQDRMALGSTPGSLEVWLLMRSLRTLHLRAERQSQTATQLSAWLHEATKDP